MGFASNNRKTVGNPAQNLSQAHVLELISTGSEYTVVIGGNREFTGAGSFGWNTSPILGGGTLGHFLDGDVAELVLYDRKIDAGEHARLQSYFDARYGL